MPVRAILVVVGHAALDHLHRSGVIVVSTAMLSSPEAQPRPQRLMTKPAAALCGVVAVLAALGAGHLVAGYLDPQSSPYLAVGNSFIDRTPAWLKNFAISTFGTNDKLALLLGMGAVMLLVGAAAGLLCRRNRAAGTGFIVLLGIVGTLAALGRPDTKALGVLAPLAAVVVGVAVLLLLVRQATPDAIGGPLSRRSFLGTAAALAAAAGLGAVVGQRARNSTDVAASRSTVGSVTPVNALAPAPGGADFLADGGLPFITPNADFYRIDTAFDPPRIRAEDWSLRIHGMVDKEITINFAQLMARPQLAQRVTFTCVSYEVGGDLVGNADWVGVSLRDLLLEAGVRPGADQIFSSSQDGFTASTPVDVVLQPDRGAMLAVNMNGEPLPVEHGFPVRMLVPGLYGFVSATKWITDIELTTRRKAGVLDAAGVVGPRSGEDRFEGHRRPPLRRPVEQHSHRHRRSLGATPRHRRGADPRRWRSLAGRSPGHGRGDGRMAHVAGGRGRCFRRQSHRRVPRHRSGRCAADGADVAAGPRRCDRLAQLQLHCVAGLVGAVVVPSRQHWPTCQEFGTK